ncbi:MAG: hypothetical protein JJU00_15660 [Opitutales bacterium]|nr:hypothetical protein [Opitutales bacterium]
MKVLSSITFVVMAVFLLSGCDAQHLGKISDRVLQDSGHVPTEIYFESAIQGHVRSVAVRDRDLIVYLLTSFRNESDGIGGPGQRSTSLGIRFVFEDLTIRTGGQVQRPANVIALRIGHDGGDQTAVKLVDPVPERIEWMFDFLIDPGSRGEKVLD